jgi:hypothetical protein
MSKFKDKNEKHWLIKKEKKTSKPEQIFQT